MARDDRPRCAVIIPTYNGVNLVRRCLDALLSNPPTDCTWTVIVVDDSSNDGTVAAIERYRPLVRVHVLDQNCGFATACNHGASEAHECDYLVFLNNDTIPVSGWLDALVRDIQANPDVAAVGARLLFPNGTVQHAGVTIGEDRWPHHLYTGFPGEHPAVMRPREVVAVTGACMLIRHNDFHAEGGFDTRFHNGYEDIDLCLRLGQSGRRIRYCPNSVVYHLESVTRWREGREPTDSNDLLYVERWLNRVVPDDMQHYLSDELLTVEYPPYYPVRLNVSPLLATVTRHDAEDRLERILSARSRQVMDLLAVQIRDALERSRPALPRGGRESEGSRATPALVQTGKTHAIGQGSARHFVSLLMPVKNEATSMRELLPLVLNQAFPVMLEIVAVDSGSEDDTIDALREYDATIISIEPRDFDHGLTRNLLARHARGDVLVYLNGRSRPADTRWLGPLVTALDGDAAVAGACSRVMPHSTADILSRRDGELELSGANRRERKEITDWRIYEEMSADALRAFLNFHTVSAALRADTLAQIPFRSVRTIGEDLLWAREILEAGHALVHEPRSVIYHSHPYTLGDLFRRNVDDGIANRDIVGRSLSEEQIRPLVTALVERDWKYLEGEAELEDGELEYWQREAVLRRLAEVAGQWMGTNYRQLPDDLAMTFSRIGRTRTQDAD